MTQGSRKPTALGLGAPPPPGIGGAADPFGQFEEPEELAGEATRLDSGLLLAEQPTNLLDEQAPRPFLQCEAGKDAGKQYVLSPGETGVGRSVDNEVILTDLSVSRKHLKVVLEPAGTLKLVDLGSGNGTLLNGSRVREAPLREGDRIELGETVLVVRIPAGAGAGPSSRGVAGPPVPYAAAALPYAPGAAGPGGIVHGLATSPVGHGAAAGGAVASGAVASGAVGGGGASAPGAVGPAGVAAYGGPVPVVVGQGTAPHGSLAAPSGAPSPFAAPPAGTPAPGSPLGGPAVAAGPSGALPAPGPVAGPAATPTPTAIATPAPRGGPPKALLIVGGVLGAIVLVGAGAVLAIALVGGDGAGAAAAADPAIYQGAVAAYEQRRWDEAETRFRAVLAAHPADPQAAQYLQLIQAGRAHEQTIVGARAALAGGDARAALAQVAAVPAESPLVADAEAVRQAARDQIVRSLVEEARVAHAAGQAAAAQAKLAEASSFDPTSILVAQARAELGGAGTPSFVAAVPAPSAGGGDAVATAYSATAGRGATTARGAAGGSGAGGGAAGGGSGASAGAGGGGAAGGGTAGGGAAGGSAAGGGGSGRGNAQALSERAMAAYRAGDYGTAASTMRQAADAAGRADRRYADHAGKLERLARDLPRAQSPTATPQALQSVIQLDESIPGGGAVARTLKPRLATMLVEAANRAWATGDVPGACSKARQALAADANNRPARDLDGRCIQKVGELMGQAQRAERTNRQQAVGLYRQVTQIAPAGSPPYTLATERIGALEGGGGAGAGAAGGGPTRTTAPTPTGPTRTTGPTPTGPRPAGPTRTTGPTPLPTPAGGTGPTKVRRPIIMDEDE